VAKAQYAIIRARISRDRSPRISGLLSSSSAQQRSSLVLGEMVKNVSAYHVIVVGKLFDIEAENCKKRDSLRNAPDHDAAAGVAGDSRVIVDAGDVHRDPAFPADLGKPDGHVAPTGTDFQYREWRLRCRSVASSLPCRYDMRVRIERSGKTAGW